VGVKTVPRGKLDSRIGSDAALEMNMQLDFG